ncbi:MAG: PLP-dependent transferase [Opitutus sp.]|nr:PLP-dependent transferase [Opitutus sp.]
MAAVIGYEERDPHVLARMAAGYPRFTVHPLVRELTDQVAAQHARPGEQLWPVLTMRAAGVLAQHLGQGRIFETDGVVFVAHRTDPALAQRAKLWLQHTGGLLSSRGAEDALVRRGARAHAAEEATFSGDATVEVKRVLTPLFRASADQLVLASSGMSAVHAAFRAITAEQAPRGRTAWVQLGWLYLDTIALLKKFTPDPTRDHLVQLDVTNLGALDKLFAKHGARIAGVITEAPTNPLLQTGDLAAIAALAWKHGARVIVDPSMASPFNVDVLPHADVVTFSLTKYASHAGDVMAGAVIVNSARAGAHDLRAAVAAQLDAPYPRDLARLAAEIAAAPAVATRINASTPAVAEFLTRHPAVARVWWSHQEATRANYARLARSTDACGAVISFTLRKPFVDFYDRVALAKGPSFGMSTTLLCPYVYLAHYDLLPHCGGGDALARAGLAPELLRLSVGTEPAEEIIATLAAALA